MNRFIACPHCGKKIAAGAIQCIHCGEDCRDVLILSDRNETQNEPGTTRRTLRIAAIAAGVLTGVGCLFVCIAFSSVVIFSAASDPTATLTAAPTSSHSHDPETATIQRVSSKTPTLTTAPTITQPPSTLTPTVANSATSLPTPTATKIPTQTHTPPPSATRTSTATSQPTATTRPPDTAVPTTASCTCSGNVYNCASFPLPDGTTADQCFDYCIAQGAGDIHGLDGDNDNHACENN